MIGILDSGVGGLSIYHEVKRLYPEAGVIYLADKANFPYGEKTEKELLVIVRAAVSTLIGTGATVIIIACNSATVSTISHLREEFQIPIIGIEPAVKQAEKVTKNGKIGVLATKRTVEQHGANDKLLKVHNAELVSRIEYNQSGITDEELRAAIKPFSTFGADTVVLGCTHYSFIQDRLARLYPEITFLEPTEAVVSRLMMVMDENNLDITQGDDIFLGIDEADARKI